MTYFFRRANFAGEVSIIKRSKTEHFVSEYFFVNGCASKMSEKFLIILSSSRAFEPALKYIKEHFDVRRIDTLVTRGLSQEPETPGIEGKTLRLDKNGFHPKALSQALRSELISEDYDKIIMLCNDIYLLDYKNVENLVLSLNPKQAVAIDSKQQIRSIGFLSRVWLYIRRGFTSLLMDLKVSSDLMRVRHKIYTSLGYTPILVYTMGKVGSSTAYHSLQKNQISPLVYHVHFLTNSNIQRITKKYKKTGKYASEKLTIGQIIKGKLNHLLASKLLSKHRLHNPEEKWRLITLIRDPVSLFLSHVFQNPHVHRPFLLDEQGNLVEKKVKDYIHQYFDDLDSSYSHEWFNSEFKKFTGIDVYKIPFNSTAGYTVFENQKYDVAIISLEKINQAFNLALTELMGKDYDVSLENRNIRKEKEGADLYDKIKKAITIKEEALKKVYSTKYAQHFFSDDFRIKMIKKWSNPRI